jgi:hypothetical protein
MEQTKVRIGEVNVPVILDRGEEWFPVSYITTKMLLRSGKNSLINKNNKDNTDNHLQKYIIQYGEKNVQESNCISKTGLIELLYHTQVGRLSVGQMRLMNIRKIL